MKPVVAIVGRPNVGKSTFINRLVGSRQAIVHDLPGVTRDRLYLSCDWAGREFIAIDTGGIIPGEEDELLSSVREQAEVAIQEADVVLFIVDYHDGPTPADHDIAHTLRQTKKPVIVAVNKCDNFDKGWMSTEFYALGLGDLHTISAIHGLGVGDLLDAVVERLPAKEGEDDPEELKIAIVGRPNVGKSSLTNALLGQERMIVSPISGTTRDAIDSKIKFHGKEYMLIDTAGIRRKARVDYGVEQFSVVRSLKAIERSDVVVVVIDSVDGVTEQDQRIAGMADDAGKACIIIANKWDLVEKDSSTINAYTKSFYEQLYFMNYAPILFTSAVTRKRLPNIFEMIEAAASENNRRVTTGLMNQVLNEAVALNPPPSDKGVRARIYYATQVSVKPPTFLLFCNNPRLIPDSYKRYLENKIRESFGFSGTPIRMIFRDRKEKD